MKISKLKNIVVEPMKDILRELKEAFAYKPYRLIWILIWIVPFYLTLIFLSVLSAILHLNWKEGVELFRSVS